MAVPKKVHQPFQIIVKQSVLLLMVKVFISVLQQNKLAQYTLKKYPKHKGENVLSHTNYYESVARELTHLGIARAKLHAANTK